jgi:hypothetical protein
VNSYQIYYRADSGGGNVTVRSIYIYAIVIRR